MFGFSAYSPTKFAIVGLAQVLRMELKAHDIYVCVAYPPDTDTPGFVEENKSKPEECRLISETAGLFTAEQVAKDIVRGLQHGQFSIYSGVDGWMLAHLTAGMGPVSSLLDAAMQVGLMSLFRFISLFYLMSFDDIVGECPVGGCVGAWVWGLGWGRLGFARVRPLAHSHQHRRRRRQQPSASGSVTRRPRKPSRK